MEVFLINEDSETVILPLSGTSGVLLPGVMTVLVGTLLGVSLSLADGGCIYVGKQNRLSITHSIARVVFSAWLSCLISEDVCFILEFCETDFEEPQEIIRIKRERDIKYFIGLCN